MKKSASAVKKIGQGCTFSCRFGKLSCHEPRVSRHFDATWSSVGFSAKHRQRWCRAITACSIEVCLARQCTISHAGKSSAGSDRLAGRDLQAGTERPLERRATVRTSASAGFPLLLLHQFLEELPNLTEFFFDYAKYASSSSEIITNYEIKNNELRVFWQSLARIIFLQLRTFQSVLMSLGSFTTNK